MSQLNRLRTAMAEASIPAVLISDPTNVGWLTGFTGSFARVVVTATDAVFITDSRYAIQSEEQVHELPIAIFASPVNGDVFLAEHVNRLGVTLLAFEDGTTTYAAFQVLASKLPGVELVPVGELLSKLRQVKTSAELTKVKEACAIADATFAHLVGLIQPGRTEYDVHLDLEFYIRRQGAGIAFHPIVVSGERSARPHGVASDRVLRSGDFLTMDFGATVDGYHSDLTRTVAIGPITDRHREVYGAVLEANLAAIDAMKPGVAAKDVDAIARQTLDKYGLAKYFGHGLGHGLGRLVHDTGRFSASSSDILEPGQIWTVEPGVYIEGFGGVRIEDDVVVTETGVEILTHSTKELLVLPIE